MRREISLACDAVKSRNPLRASGMKASEGAIDTIQGYLPAHE
jgi:hypothetical protein